MSLSSSHLKRYKEIASLFWKYGRSDFVQHMGMAEDFAVPESTTLAAKAAPEQLATDLEAMGPTYIKIGQVLAGRPDLIPHTYTKALERLQDNVAPFPFLEVEQIVTTELGVKLSSAFASFDPVPLAAASLGQVHFATLRDGRPVVVKVQRPNIRQQIADDFEALAAIAKLLDEHTEMGRTYRFATVLEEFRTTIQNELNYEREAQNLVTVGRNLAGFALIQVPQPVPDYCTRSVLTMDYVQGKKVTMLTPLARLDIAGRPLAEELLKAYLKQVLVDGIFHADPHPGNVFITDDGRVALLDLGMVGYTSPGLQENLLKLVLSVSHGRGEEAAELVIRMSEKRDTYDAPGFRRHITHLVAIHRDQDLQSLQLGRSLLELSRHARDCGLFVPSELTLLGKALLQLDEIGRILDPTFDPNATIQQQVGELIRARLRNDFTQAQFFTSLLELKEFVSQLPVRMNRIMDAITNSELEVKVRAVDANVAIDGMQKIANRIAMSIVLAALIIGASLLMRVPTAFTIFGYPGLAMLCFLFAAAGGFWLVISIFVKDYKSWKKLKR
jgi:ubiquinone biosynthesis protein